MSFPIVGIGASGGGLESISALLAGIPASTGMAYVFVQHLDPGHVSHLAELLSNRAALPVEEAREGEIFPDHLYVMIPNTTLTITSHVLHLTSRDPAQRLHRPVDMIFLSLAENRGPNQQDPCEACMPDRTRRPQRAPCHIRSRSSPHRFSCTWSSFAIGARQISQRCSLANYASVSN
jgi:CheB methylesterase